MSQCAKLQPTSKRQRLVDAIHLTPGLTATELEKKLGFSKDDNVSTPLRDAIRHNQVTRRRTPIIEETQHITITRGGAWAYFPLPLPKEKADQ